ncbi:c6 transcription factor [Diplodia corticola]|uniref:C6 transcription factor n=1 Tax=Diplodia corticola TaxID=236234 RepID=A0A1J9R7U7_9PEZI|nr:c6 transcription factor [Diplodia corticola]OJD36274.1 c6 transcription factor [Diplodia corticola]
MAAHTPSETMALEDAPSASASGTTPWATPTTQQEPDHTPRDASEQPDQPDQPDGLPDQDPQSPSADHASDSHAPRQVPMQKRRRVTRACDECRRKKIKCDGKQPCTHCTVYSYECTYDQPSNRRRNAAPQYVEALENRMKRAEALLGAILPNVDLDDPALVASLQEGVLPPLPQAQPQARPFAAPDSSQMAPAPAERPMRVDTMNPQAQSGEGQLESMVRATGQLDLDEHGHWDYHGHSSGLSFVRRMRERFDFMGRGESESSPFPVNRPLSHVFESPKSVQDSPATFDNAVPGGAELPSREKARELCDTALNDASALLRIVHLPSFWTSFEALYAKSPEEYGAAENSFLPLLYTVLALGTLFSRTSEDLDEVGYQNAIDQGVQYFKAARNILDIAMCRDLHALQAVIFMILFLQSSAKLSTCYAYIGIALRSALRMGLHRSMNDRFNPIENESRKRIFWVIRKMDIYVGALLGLPHTMSNEDVDQELPAELDDEYITETEYLSQPPGHVSLITACNAHTTLIDILAKVVRVVYPIKGKTHILQGQKIMSYTVSYADIRELEKDLQQWMENLPMALKPGGEASILVTRVRQLLRMAYAHTQMMLYRPFVHYVSKSPTCASLDKRAYACASACISVSRNIIHITAEMKKRGMLNGCYWFTMYTTFFSIMTLVYFALENPESPTSQDVLKEAYEGKDVLEGLAKRSMAADRCTSTLKAVFDQLPERIQQGRELALANASRKRRQAPSPQPDDKSMSGLSEPDLHDVQAIAPRRANTFPKNVDDPRARGSFRPSFPQPPDLDDPPQSQFGTGPALPHSMPTTHSFYPHGVQHNMTPSPVFRQAQQPQMSQFGFLPAHNTFIDRINGFNPPIPDLSAMMFPSGDPLAYPNQPMTTFENNGFSSIDRVGDSANAFLAFSGSGGTGTPVSNRSAGSNRNSGIFGMAPNAGPRGDPHAVDVELHNPSPFIFAAGTQFGMNPNAMHATPHPHGRQMFGVGTGVQDGMAATSGAGMGGPMAMAGTGSMNINDLFTGEEWAGMFAEQGSGMGQGQGMGFGFR